MDEFSSSSRKEAQSSCSLIRLTRVADDESEREHGRYECTPADDEEGAEGKDEKDRDGKDRQRDEHGEEQGRQGFFGSGAVDKVGRRVDVAGLSTVTNADRRGNTRRPRSAMQERIRPSLEEAFARWTHSDRLSLRNDFWF